MSTDPNSRPWLKHYPAGVPHDIELDIYPSLPAMAEEAFRKYPDRAAVTCMDKTLSYRELDQLSQALGAWLQSRGMQPGARVALMMPNVLQYAVAILAVLRAGYVVANVNPLYTPRELEHQLKDSGAEAIIILENFATTLEAVIAHTQIKTVVLASVGDLLGLFKGMLVNYVVRHKKKAVPPFNLHGAIRFNDALSAGRSMTLKKPQLGPEDISFLQYTGGTTGVAKGAVLVHSNITNNSVIAEKWLQPALDDKSKGPPPEQLVFISALPMYHIFCLVSIFWLSIKLGGRNILIPNPRDMDSVVKALKPFKFNVLPAVNTLFNGLVNHEGFRGLDFSGLRVSNGGGMAVQRAVAESWLKLTNTPIIEGYGLTETSSGATCNPVMSTEYSGDVGMPMPSTYVSLRDDDENVVADGQPGEICIKGPQVMRGYWQRPDETAKVMTKDGFFKSGDVGILLPSGHVKIVDRKKDMILVSGFNVYPNEIEDVVASCPGVLECAVIGIPDEKSGEAVKLFIVKKDPNLTLDTVKAYCRDNLTGYKNPKAIVFRDSLPKTNVGKILRRELRDLDKAGK
ncbi:MAG: long-chain-fatty-acid--CoA ligase [Betaproteobacteria bacterium]|nr:long-chain-fatty-acid--CoA ligase [Betaproteobacteria bacterium]